ncbi:probable pectin methylesterase CGR3 [Abrus precatorius]|uniref:Probable pectin methylesterase CGR3 n=1 Tax=Abrus precatorius TaxID=3816 RepID=A0A8B8JJF0_ABRPR|nr:probable pectin methylesterase CGR3 [Abrus precatorius]XP_027331596.1 probable pectin methylesterase CGR3 [Abrus precatorius]
MSRRTGNPFRRFGDSGGGLFSTSKSRSSPVLSVALVVVGGLFLIGYLYRGSGGFGSGLDSVSRVEGDYLCSGEVQRAIPVLQKAYGDSMHKVLHVGPDTCYVVSKLLKEEETEAWGIEPYDIEDADNNCKALIRSGSVRVADIKFPLPYRPKSFSLVVVSDALDYLSPRYLNKTLPDLVRVATDGIVIFTGFPSTQKAKIADVSKFGRAAKMRSSSWWVRYFLQTNLEENEAASKKFEQASTKSSYDPRCQIFHLKSLH